MGLYPPKLREPQNQTRVKPKISLFEEKIRESSKSAENLVPDNGPTVDLTIANDRSENELKLTVEDLTTDLTVRNDVDSVITVEENKCGERNSDEEKSLLEYGYQNAVLHMKLLSKFRVGKNIKSEKNNLEIRVCRNMLVTI